MRFPLQMSIGFLGLWILIAPVDAAVFSDIGNSPHASAITFLQEHGIIGGYSDGTFRPAATVNRAELSKMLVTALGIPADSATYHACFPDVTTQWFAPFVCVAKEKGWVKGYADGTFHPAATVNTAEALKMIVSALGYTLLQSSASSTFEDVDPAAWYASYVTMAKQAGLLDAIPGNRLGVGDGLTRGSLSSILYNAIMARGKEENSSQNVFNLGVRHGGQSEGPRTPVLTFADIAAQYGDPSFTVAALSNSDGHITYSIADTAIATISGNTVTIHGAGSTSITATQAATSDFTSASKTASLTITGITPTITFGNLLKSNIDSDFTLSPTSDSAGSFTFISGNTSVASITGNSVHLPGTPGIITVTANQAAGGNYSAGTKSITLTVYATYCVASPCVHGTCTPVFHGDIFDDTANLSCSCDSPYSGTFCDESDTNCSAPGYCNTGRCQADNTGGSCVDCAACLTGDRCQTAIPSCGAERSELLCLDVRESRNGWQ